MVKKNRQLFILLIATMLLFFSLQTVVQAKSDSGTCDISSISAISGMTASYSWNDGGTSAGNGSGTVVVSDGTIECSATSRGTVISHGATTLKLTLTNKSGTEKRLEFDVSYLNGGSNISSVKVASATASNGYHYSGTIANDASIIIELKTTSKRNTQYTAAIALKNFAFYTENNVTITFGEANKDQKGVVTGTYTLNGNAPTAGEYTSREITGLDVTPAAGYRFEHWVTADGTVLGNDPTKFTKPDSNAVVSPYFVPTDAATYQVDSRYYYYWNDAVTAAVAGGNKIILSKDGTLPGSEDYNFTGTYAVKNADGTISYTIPSGVTLLIPFDNTNFMRGVPAEVTAYNAGVGVLGAMLPPNDGIITFSKRDSTQKILHRTLTIASGAHITVNGVLEVSGQSDCYTVGSYVKGKHSVVHMESGSSITVNGTLFAWGEINGSGTVTVNSGANVYENFVNTDYMGDAGVMNNINKAGAFPLVEFVLDGVQVPLTLKQGGNIRGFYCLYGNLIGYNTFIIDFVGADGVFKNEAGDIEFYYKDSRQKLNVLNQGRLTLNPLKLSMSAAGVTANLDSSATSGLPMGKDWDVVVKSGGTLTAKESAILFAGSTFTVEENGNVSVIPGKQIVVLDAATDPSSVGQDAVLNIRGTATADGIVYTAGTAGIMSDGTTGSINITKAGTDQDIVLRKDGAGTDEDGNAINWISVTVNPAKLKNADGSYLATANTGAGTYLYNTGHEKWAFNEHKITDEVKAPTCKNNGYTKHTCSCGYSYQDTETDPNPSAHNYVREAEYLWDLNDPSKPLCEVLLNCLDCDHRAEVEATVTSEVKTPATCIEDGVMLYTATFDDAYSTWLETQTCEVKIPKTNHKYDNACDAVCNVENCGNVREVPGHKYDNACDTTCNICSAIREVGDHVYDDVCDANCNECYSSRVPPHNYENEFDAECNSCGQTRTIHCEHANVEILESVAPTCVSAGKTEGKKCTDCKAVFEPQQTIPSTGTEHSWKVEIAYVWSKDGKQCVATRYCEHYITHSESTTATVTSAETQAPTCSDLGWTTYTANFEPDWAVDGQTMEVQDVPIRHSEEIVEGYAATCTTNGLTDGKKCTECGKVTVVQNTITALGHEWSETEYTWGVDGKTCSAKRVCSRDNNHEEVIYASVTGELVTPAGCTTNGTTKYTAIFDKDWAVTKTNEVNDIPAAHKPGEVTVENQVAADCENDGSYDNVVYCTVCGEELGRENVTVPAQSHDYIDHDALAPTCTEIGWNAYQTCSRCDYTTYAEIPASCVDTDDDGYCNRCGGLMCTHECEQKKLPAVAPTCTEDGLTEGAECTKCGVITTPQKTDPALDHDIVVDEAKAPTCTETGLMEGSHCSRCDDATIEQEVVPALNHDIVIDEAKAPTCTETGLTEGSHCSRCDDATVEQEVVSARGHLWDNDCDKDCNRKDCTETRETEHNWASADCVTPQTCLSCTITEGDPLGHAWDNDCDTSCNRNGCNEIREATHIGDKWIHEGGNTHWKVCERCEQKYDELAHRDEDHNNKCDDCRAENVCKHSEVIDAAVEPDCLNTGLTEGKHCSVCNAVIVAQNVVPAKGHAEETIPAVEATCTATGLAAGVKCGVCGEILIAQVETPKVDHDYDAVETLPTCKNKGFTTYTCVDCGDSYKTYGDPATGKHEYKPCANAEYRWKECIGGCGSVIEKVVRKYTVIFKGYSDAKDIVLEGVKYTDTIIVPTLTSNCFELTGFWSVGGREILPHSELSLSAFEALINDSDEIVVTGNSIVGLADTAIMMNIQYGENLGTDANAVIMTISVFVTIDAGMTPEVDDPFNILSITGEQIEGYNIWHYQMPLTAAQVANKDLKVKISYGDDYTAYDKTVYVSVFKYAQAMDGMDGYGDKQALMNASFAYGEVAQAYSNGQWNPDRLPEYLKDLDTPPTISYDTENCAPQTINNETAPNVDKDIAKIFAAATMAETYVLMYGYNLNLPTNATFKNAWIILSDNELATETRWTDGVGNGERYNHSRENVNGVQYVVDVGNISASEMAVRYVTVYVEYYDADGNERFAYSQTVKYGITTYLNSQIKAYQEDPNYATMSENWYIATMYAKLHEVAKLADQANSGKASN